MDCLSEYLCNTQTGCNVGGVMINHLMHADDLVILSTSVKGLQRLLDTCDVYGQNHDILFNHDKKVCMYMPSGNCYYLNTPVVVLNGIQLAFVRTYTYLGTVMTCDNADDANMRRQRGICYDRASGIIKTFSMCAPEVKATLFRTFCSNMYCSQLWHDFRSGSIRQLIVGYNHSFRHIMNYPRNCSASGMFVFNDIPSFMELWRNYIYGVMQRLINSDNSVVAALFLPVGCHPPCGGAGSLFDTLKPAALSSFFMSLVSVYLCSLFVRQTLASVLIILCICVCMYHDLYFVNMGLRCLQCLACNKLLLFIYYYYNIN